MLVRMNGLMGQVVNVPEAKPNQLVVDRLYLVVITTRDDEGNDRIEQETCWTMDCNVKNQNGSPKVRLRFTKSSQDFYISQLPLCRFFGPMEFEIVKDEQPKETIAGFGSIIQHVVMTAPEEK